MKWNLIIAVAGVLAIGCATPKYTIETRASSRNQWPGRPIVSVGGREFADIEDLKAFVRSLPPRSLVVWDTGLVGYDQIPLAHSDMTLEAFGEYCREHQVRFRIRTGWGQILVTRVYNLRESGFKDFVELESSPAIGEARTKRAFAECGMPYAPDLKAWFMELGVPFGTGSSVVYEREKGRLFVQNTRTSQGMVSDIVAWSNAREFDQKMDCLENRLKGTDAHP